jgi:hypothetical protein
MTFVHDMAAPREEMRGSHELFRRTEAAPPSEQTQADRWRQLGAFPARSRPAEGMPAVPARSSSPTAAPETPTPAAQGRVLLIHGYSADWKAFLPWKQALADAGIAADTISVGNYVTLNN